jgi:CRP/FNR family transcriptional regulator, anaerobic regulatory protein
MQTQNSEINKAKYSSRTRSGIDCGVCVNQNCIIKTSFSVLSNSELIKQKNDIHCKKGQQFIIEGAPVNGLFFILKGKVKVFRTGINGREQIVRFAKDGEIIGHRGFGTEEYYSIGAIALENTVLCYFSKKFLQDTLRETPQFTYNLMLFYANELNGSESKVKSLSQMTVRERVVDTLLYINRKFKQKNNYLDLVLSRKEYADFAGTTEEQVIRVFSVLKKEKLISASGKRIGLLNEQRLKEEIEEHNYFLGS